MAEDLQQQRRLAAIMFTDMVGYSALSQTNEAVALELLNEHRKLLRDVFARHGAREIEAVGDGFFVECPSALAAARCAVEIQRTLHERNISQPPERHIRIRVGLHVGDVVAQGERVHGDGVNIAARIESLAEPGGVFCSEDVARQIQNKIDLPLRRLGKADLKNIQTPVEIYRLILPWERKHLPGSEQLAFTLHRKGLRRIAIVTVPVILLAILLGTAVFSGKRAEQAPPERSVNSYRIAVLPFTNISADPQDDYFADGLTEEMISYLAKVARLRVIARTSVMTYKGSTKSVSEIGRELNVGTILEGSVRKAADKVRVTAQLIDVSTQEHLWSQEYDRELRDVFAIQSDIAKRVTEALQVQLMAGEKRLIEKKGTGNPDAYTSYLKGLYHLNKYTEEGFKKAIEHFERAIAQDSAYAQAYAMIGSAYDQLGFFGFLPQKVALSKAQPALRKALELDPTNADAYAELGNIKVFDYDWAGAEVAFKRAVELSPNSAMAHYWYAISYLSPVGRYDEAIAEMSNALELDPISLQINGDLVCAFQHAGRYDESIAQSRKALDLDPKLFVAYWCVGKTYVEKKMYSEAIAAFQKMEEASGGWSGARAMLGWAYAAAGQKAQAHKILAELTDRAKREEIPPIFFVAILAGLGEKDQAFRWLDKAYEERSGYLVYIKVDSWYDNLRSDPRFIALLSRMGLKG